MASVGTTAEVLAVKEDMDDLSGLAATRIKAIGRQRFKVLSTTRQLGGFDSFCVSAYITFVSCLLVCSYSSLGWDLIREHLATAAAVSYRLDAFLEHAV